MIEKYDAVLFDLDGTLVDSMWLWQAIDIEYLAGFGLEVPDNLGHEIDGMGFSETAVYFKERFNIPDSVEQIKETWNSMAYDFYCTRVPLKEGAKEFLKYLKKNGYKIAIGTSNSIELVKNVLEALEISDYFDTIVTACMVNAGKPKPDIYLKAAENLSVEPSKCIVFEDIIQGIMAGKNAGMTTVAVADNYSKDSAVEKAALADYYIDNFYEFINLYCN